MSIFERISEGRKRFIRMEEKDFRSSSLIIFVFVKSEQMNVINKTLKTAKNTGLK